MLGVETQDVVEPGADPGKLRRQCEDLAELPIPADEVQFLVEHGDALPHMVERGLQDLSVVVDGSIGIVEQLERRLGRDRALAQKQREHEAGRGGTDRRSEQMLGVTQQLKVRLHLRIDADATRQGIAVERGPGSLFAEIAGDGGGQLLDRHRGAPQPEGRRNRREVGGNEQVGLHPLDRRWLAPEGKHHISQNVEREAPHHAVRERRQIEPEQRLRAQHHNAPRTLRQQALGDDAGIRHVRQQQRIGPGQDSDRHPRHGSARGSAPPDQPAEESGRKLCHRRKGQQSDRGQLRIAGHAIVDVGEKQNHADRDPSHREQQAADIVAPGDQRLASLQHERHQDVIRYHDGERDRFHDHHRGRRREAANECCDREQIGMRGERQRQHEHVAVDLPGGERKQPGQSDGNDEQVDQHQIEREQPGGAPDLFLIVVLDHGDVKLPRQQYDGEQRQQRHREHRAEHRLAVEHGGGVRPLQRLGKERRRPVEHPECHEHADAHEGDELDDGFGRDRQHQSVLVLGGIDMARAEQHGEDSHRDCHVERDVAQHRLHRAACRSGMNEDRGQRGRHRFELKCDIGNGADDRDQRHHGRDGLGLAVAGSDEVRDRRDVLRFCEPDDPHDQRRAEADHEDRADVDRQEVEAVA